MNRLRRSVDAEIRFGCPWTFFGDTVVAQRRTRCAGRNAGEAASGAGTFTTDTVRRLQGRLARICNSGENSLVR